MPINIASKLLATKAPLLKHYFILLGRLALFRNQGLAGDPNPQYFLKSTAVQIGDVLPYKWEADCSTNRRCPVGFPFLQSSEVWKVQQDRWGADCRTNWRCSAVLSPRPVRVRASKTLLKKVSATGRPSCGGPSSAS